MNLPRFLQGDRKMLAENRANTFPKQNEFYRMPDDWYDYRPKDQTATSQPHQGTFMRNLNVPIYDRRSQGLKQTYRPLFPSRNRRPNANRKGMIIGERPSLWKVSQIRRPELPGNLFLDNLRKQPVDWATYKQVTWNDILSSHRKDIDSNRRVTQTLPQKEAWLAKIDSRVKNSKLQPNRELPYIPPRLFNPAVPAKRELPARKFKAKDYAGMSYSLEGPTDLTKKEYRPFVFPEIPRRIPTPNKLNF